MQKTSTSQIEYEWAVEETDPATENIEDVNHYPLPEIARRYPNFKLPENFAVCLVRDDWRRRGDAPRSWAYLKDGKLPEYFVDAYDNQTVKVPQRFHAEIDRLQRAATPPAEGQPK